MVDVSEQPDGLPVRDLSQRGVQRDIFRRANPAYLDLHAHLGVGNVPRIDPVAGVSAGSVRAVRLHQDFKIHDDIPVLACRDRSFHGNGSVFVADHTRGEPVGRHGDAAAHRDRAAFGISTDVVVAGSGDVAGDLYRAARAISGNAAARCARHGDTAAHRDRAAGSSHRAPAALGCHRDIAGNIDHTAPRGICTPNLLSLRRCIGDLGSAAAARSIHAAAEAGGGLHVQFPLANQRHNAAALHRQRIAGGNIDVERIPVQVEGDRLAIHDDR